VQFAAWCFLPVVVLRYVVGELLMMNAACVSPSILKSVPGGCGDVVKEAAASETICDVPCCAPVTAFGARISCLCPGLETTGPAAYVVGMACVRP
jgi:hypothetical protein